MIFGNCNIKISNLYPNLNKSGLGGWGFSIGIKKEFAKKAYEKELTETGYFNLQKMGVNMIKKVFDYEGKDYGIREPYSFTKNKKGNLTCLFSNLTVPGNACGLNIDWNINLEKSLNHIDRLNYYIEYHPHNIDSPFQCYAFLSLISRWDELMGALVHEE